MTSNWRRQKNRTNARHSRGEKAVTRHGFFFNRCQTVARSFRHATTAFELTVHVKLHPPENKREQNTFSTQYISEKTTTLSLQKSGPITSRMEGVRGELIRTTNQPRTSYTLALEMTPKSAHTQNTYTNTSTHTYTFCMRMLDQTNEQCVDLPIRCSFAHHLLFVCVLLWRRRQNCTNWS